MRRLLGFCCLLLASACSQNNLDRGDSFDSASKNGLIMIGVSADSQVDVASVAIYKYNKIVKQASEGTYLNLPKRNKFLGSFYGVAELPPGTYVIGYVSTASIGFFSPTIDIHSCFSGGTV